MHESIFIFLNTPKKPLLRNLLTVAPYAETYTYNTKGIMSRITYTVQDPQIKCPRFELGISQTHGYLRLHILQFYLKQHFKMNKPIFKLHSLV